MDGHEYEDVVQYQNEVFLPAMAKFEAHMAKFEGAELQQKGPMLKDRKESYNVVP